MSKLEKKARRARKLAARKKYKAERELGACFLNDQGCNNNGDLITHCNFCDFKVQACTEHQELGRDKAKRHLMLKHPAKTLPALMMGVLRGQSLE